MYLVSWNLEIVGETSPYGFANTRIPLKYQDLSGRVTRISIIKLPNSKTRPLRSQIAKNLSPSQG